MILLGASTNLNTYYTHDTFCNNVAREDAKRTWIIASNRTVKIETART